MISCDRSDKTVQNDTKFCPFKMIEESSKPHEQEDTSQGTKTFGTEEINAMVLTKRKRNTKAILCSSPSLTRSRKAISCLKRPAVTRRMSMLV